MRTIVCTPRLSFASLCSGGDAQPSAKKNDKANPILQIETIPNWITIRIPRRKAANCRTTLSLTLTLTLSLSLSLTLTLSLLN